MKNQHPTVPMVKVINGHVGLDSEGLWDLLGTPYDYTVNDSTLEITMLHVESIVSGHVPKGVYMRNRAASMRSLPHAVNAKATGCTIMVEFDMPVEVD